MVDQSQEVADHLKERIAAAEEVGILEVKSLVDLHIQLEKVAAAQASRMVVQEGVETAVLDVAAAEEVQPGSSHSAWLVAHS